MIQRLIRLFTHILGYKDLDTERHCASVESLCADVAIRLGCDQNCVERMRIAAVLHDIGKVGIPDFVLLKRGPLSPLQLRVAQAHVLIGESIVRDFIDGDNEDIARAVRSHHENWDGTGYPDKLAGEEIPPMARIIRGVDTYLAMVRDRPYNKARTHTEAEGELLRGSGTLYEPRVVDAIIGVVLANKHRAAELGEQPLRKSLLCGNETCEERQSL